ncbi:Predicted bifunctional spore maturation protein, fused SpmA/SpmB [gamma proteobacterium HdN1]|nr:Predicted bifunctional spore maturation protein, fused SpmA/SpmB [gamma proteobacterium HdN1]
MLNRIWLSFFFIAFLVAGAQAFSGNWAAVDAMQRSLFATSKLAAEIALGLIGLMAFWLGLFKVAEDAGLIRYFSRILTPLFRRLMPEVPAGHPAIGSVSMNLMANMLGLDNAATPLGLRAMADLQTLNPRPEVATNAQIFFLVLNCSSVTLIPVTIFLYRTQFGAASPADVFLPILLATSASTLAGMLVVMLVQRIRLNDPVLLLWLGGFAVCGALFMSFLLSLSGPDLQLFSSRLAGAAVLLIVLVFLLAGATQRIDAYASFVQGAKEGFDTAIKIMPYLVAMLVAVAVLRESGALGMVLDGLRSLIALGGWDTRWVDAMPVALMKPLSGSGARALMLETMQHFGVDSFQARLATVVQGSTETTFYVLTLYFGSVGVVKIRHALWCGLFADLAGVIAAIAVCYWFYG